MKLNRKGVSRLLLLLSVPLVFLSCKLTPPTRYFTNIDQTALEKAGLWEPTVRPGDILGITIYSDNPTATAIFNQSGGNSPSGESSSAGSSMVGASAGTSPDYIVDKNGEITIHAVGKLKVSGKTLPEIDSMLKLKLAPYLLNPYMTVRIKNFRVTVVGEVGKPGIVSPPSNKLNVLEAVAMAGDVTMSGLKEDIVVIRDHEGSRKYGRLDLTDANSVRSPFFQLEQNDIVIVNPNPLKPGISEQLQLRRLTIITTVVSLLTSIALVVSIFK